MITSEMVRNARNAKGLSLRQLASKIGISHSVIGSWEKGTLPSLINALSVAQELDIDTKTMETAYTMDLMEHKKENAIKKRDAYSKIYKQRGKVVKIQDHA